jgi:hypothetical protein
MNLLQSLAYQWLSAPSRCDPIHVGHCATHLELHSLETVSVLFTLVLGILVVRRVF